MYKNGNPSLYSQASAVPQLKNRPSYDQMKSLKNALHVSLLYQRILATMVMI